jgi:hypothetical protein
MQNLPLVNPFGHARFVDEQTGLVSGPLDDQLGGVGWLQEQTEVSPELLVRLSTAAATTATTSGLVSAGNDVITSRLRGGCQNAVLSSRDTVDSHMEQSSSVVGVIQPVMFHNKLISSLCKHGDPHHYVLIEVIARVFFPDVQLERIAELIEVVLGVPVVMLTAEEEKYLINFYQIPAPRLHCNKMVPLEQLAEVFPALERVSAATSGPVYTAAAEIADNTGGQMIVGQLFGTVGLREVAGSRPDDGVQVTVHVDDDSAARTKRRRQICTEVIEID